MWLGEENVEYTTHKGTKAMRFHSGDACHIADNNTRMPKYLRGAVVMVLCIHTRRKQWLTRKGSVFRTFSDSTVEVMDVVTGRKRKVETRDLVMVEQCASKYTAEHYFAQRKQDD